MRLVSVFCHGSFILVECLVNPTRMPKTDLPFGDAFSHRQLDKRMADDEDPLVEILELVEEYQGDPDGFDDRIEQEYYSKPDVAMKVRQGLGPRGYQLVDEDFEFTEIGEELYELRDDPDEMYDRFATHILRNRHGQKYIEIIEDLQNKGISTVEDRIKDEFRKQYQFHIDESSNHISQLRGWLAQADVINTRTHHIKIDRAKVTELIGADSDDIVNLDSLTTEQQAFLRALVLIDPKGDIQNTPVKDVAEEAYGVDISQSNISKNILDPLADVGYIEWEHVTGNPNIVRTTNKFEAEVLGPILEDLAERHDIDIRVIRKSFEELLEEMDSGSTYEKGVALETLALKLGRLLGFEFVGWRVRGRATAGNEVDVVMDDVGTLYNRVQIQCKNTKKEIERKHVAREVGISRVLQSTTILMIGTSGISAGAERFATQVMNHENISIVFLDETTLKQLDEDAGVLISEMEDQSASVQWVKRLGAEDGVETAEEEVHEEADEQEVLEDYQEDIEKALQDDSKSATLDQFNDDDADGEEDGES